MVIHDGSQGFGVQFVSYYSALSYTIKNKNHSFIFYYDEQKGWNYENDECKKLKKGFECFFKRIDNGNKEIQKGNWNKDHVSKLYNVLLPPVNGYYKNLFTDLNDGFVYPEMDYWSDLLIPPDFITEKSRWWEGQMANALFCLHDDILDKAKLIQTNMGWKNEESIIGIHVRHGDRKELLQYTLDDYIEQARKVKKIYGISKVFIASDDSSIFKEIYQYKEEFNFIHLPNDHINDDYQGFQWSEDTSVEQTTQMLLDLYFLSECHYLIATQKSLFAWVASRIRLGKGNEIECTRWIGSTTNKYGYWNGKSDNNECI